MMTVRGRPLLTVAALLLALAPCTKAQITTLGLTVDRVLDGGTGIEHGCLEPDYVTGLGARLSRSLGTPLTRIELSARGYFIRRPSSCVDGFPPDNATYVDDDRVNLLAAWFVSTDVRFRARLASRRAAPSLALGLGNAWRVDHNLSYFVAEARLPIVPLRRIEVGLEAEFRYFRVAADRFRRTWQNFQLIRVEPLGTVHRWSRGSQSGPSSSWFCESRGSLRPRHNPQMELPRARCFAAAAAPYIVAARLTPQQPRGALAAHLQSVRRLIASRSDTQG